jgi:hypothetical protein
VNIDEREQQIALKDMYARQKRQNEKSEKEKRIQKLRRFSVVINPLICVGFVAIFWIAGMSQYYKEV